MDIEQNDLIPTRESLLNRLRDWDDQSGWNRFFETYWKLIYRTAIKSGLRDAEAQDVVQDTLFSVCKSMPTFQYDPARGSFKSWLLTLTRWRIVDQFRKRRPTEQDPSSPSQPGAPLPDVNEIPDPSENPLEAMWEEEWQKNLIDAAMHNVKASVDLKHYQIFDLYAVKHVPVAKICDLFQVRTSYVYLVKHRVAKLIRREIRRLEVCSV